MAGGKVVCIIGIYVDDILITGTIENMNKIIKSINNNYKLLKFGKADFMLGNNVEKEKLNYTISQAQYINEMLQKC